MGEERAYLRGDSKEDSGREKSEGRKKHAKIREKKVPCELV